eukprot:TRINITY_DN8169_c0_g1_i1.p1 TRINITY_DN8169_c0_g1~~TRINITY_DN8169_c0_g1_i1.p1  ORF type:complete len:443 (-),score=41.90 TRINITY_DN8169_c0_g1_i1:25-1242(-)
MRHIFQISGVIYSYDPPPPVDNSYWKDPVTVSVRARGLFGEGIPFLVHPDRKHLISVVCEPRPSNSAYNNHFIRLWNVHSQQWNFACGDCPIVKHKLNCKNSPPALRPTRAQLFYLSLAFRSNSYFLVVLGPSFQIYSVSPTIRLIIAKSNPRIQFIHADCNHIATISTSTRHGWILRVWAFTGKHLILLWTRKFPSSAWTSTNTQTTTITKHPQCWLAVLGRVKKLMIKTRTAFFTVDLSSGRNEMPGPAVEWRHIRKVCNAPMLNGVMLLQVDGRRSVLRVIAMTQRMTSLRRQFYSTKEIKLKKSICPPTSNGSELLGAFGCHAVILRAAQEGDEIVLLSTTTEKFFNTKIHAAAHHRRDHTISVYDPHALDFYLFVSPPYRGPILVRIPATRTELDHFLVI